MTSIYLSSENPRWIPKTEADLQAAIDGGLLDETHYLDLKEAPSSKGDNKELARDLASFAVDGGTLLVGIKEDKETRTFELAPQPLNGLPEKVEQSRAPFPIRRSTSSPRLSRLPQAPATSLSTSQRARPRRTWLKAGTSAAETKPNTASATRKSSDCMPDGTPSKPTRSVCCGRR